MLFRLKRLKLNGDNLVKYAEKGNYKVVEYLIRKGVHPDTKNKRNGKALDKAVKNRHWKIARLLIESGVTMPPWYNDYATTPLIWSVGEGLYGYVESLINEGVDITVPNNKGKTPLMSAAGRLGHSDNRKEHFLTFKLLLDHPDVDVNAKTKFGRTALMDAAWGGNANGVKMLLNKGADPSVRTNSGETAYKMAKERNHKDIMAILKATSKTIFDAVESGNINVLKSFLKSGANVEESTNGELTPIMLAALQNEVDCIALLSDHGANVNARTSNNRTALYLASEKGCLEAVIRLLHLGAEVNTKTTRVNTTPLMSAAGNGHESIVELLLYHKADPTVKDRTGWTAAHYAADNKCKGILKLIESRIGDINTADKYGETPLVLAAKVCDHDTLKHLLAKQGNNVSMEELCQALANAAMWDEDYDSSDEDCYKITKMIIDHQPEVAEIGGLEALKVALNDDHIETARLILDHGANIDERDEDGLTMLMHAVEHRSPDFAKLLLSLGADRSVKNNDGLTATDMAQYYSEKGPKDTRLQKVISILKSNE